MTAARCVNKAIGDIYPPGSTFKMVTGLSALNEGVANRNTTVNVNSTVLNVGGFLFYDWTAHGRVDFVNGFAHSSDIYFYTLGGGNPNTGQRRRRPRGDLQVRQRPRLRSPHGHRPAGGGRRHHAQPGVEAADLR